MCLIVVAVMGEDLPVPRWSSSTTWKYCTALSSQPEDSVGRGASDPGPPEPQILSKAWHSLVSLVPCQARSRIANGMTA